MFKNLFKKKQTPEPDPLSDLTLPKLKTGYLVDYDMKTWQVTGYNTYDWGSGDMSYEWQLTASDDVIYLERQVDDEDVWSITRKISFRDLGPGIAEHIQVHEDPPEKITYNGKKYYLDSMAGGTFFKDGTEEGYPLLSWDYEDDSEDYLLNIEQWGENDFAASVGEYVEEYQFSNILPA